MLAVLKRKQGPGIELAEVPEPEVRPDEVMIEVKACGICGSDLHIYQWDPFMHWIRLPRILGHEVSGHVHKVGERIENFMPGDRVVADTWGGCGDCYYCRLGRFNHCMHQARLGQHVDGGMTKYVVVKESGLYKIPEQIDFQEASVLEPLGVILRTFERCSMKPGDVMAIIGPGPIGLLGVMLAKMSGASTIVVSGLEEDKDRLILAKGLGAIPVNIDKENLRSTVMDLTDGKGVDLAIDASGGRGTLSEAVGITKPGGEIGLVGLGPENAFDTNTIVEKELSILGSFRRQPATWFRAINLVAQKVIDPKAIITHVLPLAHAEEGFHTVLRREGIKVVLEP